MILVIKTIFYISEIVEDSKNDSLENINIDLIKILVKMLEKAISENNTNKLFNLTCEFLIL